MAQQRHQTSPWCGKSRLEDQHQVHESSEAINKVPTSFTGQPLSPDGINHLVFRQPTSPARGFAPKRCPDFSPIDVGEPTVQSRWQKRWGH